MPKKLSSVPILLACFLFLSVICLAQFQLRPSPAQDATLKKFLQEFLGDPHPPFEQEGATRYSSALVDLKGDGTKEVILYLSGRMWCGSGSCAQSAASQILFAVRHKPVLPATILQEE